MERITKFRAQLLILIFGGVLLLFSFHLYNLQVIKTGGKADNTSTFVTYTRVKAARGDILDRNGNVLVRNRASYDLMINHYVLITADGTSDYLYKLVKRCQEAGISYEDHLPVSKERPFVYERDKYSSAWNDYFEKYLAYMEGLDSDITAPLLIEKLRERYRLPANWTEEEVRAVLGLWYELDLRRCVETLPNYTFLSDVSDEDLASIMELNIPGLNVEASTVREYSTKYAAHILGFVGPMNAEQWEKFKDNPDYTMDSHVGQDGLEAAYEQYLHGVDGLREDTVATDGTLISSRYIVEPKAGSNVELSIDINVQRAGEDAMERLFTQLRNQENEDDDGKDAEGGALVAIDVKTGQILACASYPSYDLNTFFENYNEILDAEFDPLYNRALLGIYPPGSTYKMSMVIAAIHAGILNSGQTIYAKGVYTEYAPDYAPECLFYTNYGMIHENITAAVALQVSCNYFFYELGDNIPLSAMDNTAKGLGLGEKTGIELPESQGYRANKETKRMLYSGDRAGWYMADQLSAAIGQSDNRFTPIQLAVYAATLANRGTRYKATFMNRVVSDDYRQLLYENEVTVLSHMDISDDAYLAYTTGMYLVTQRTSDWKGTAYDTFKDYPIAVAAKTGTAETGIRGTSDNGAFICYAPFDDPQIAIAVYGEKAGHGSSMAAVAKAMLDVYFEVGEVGDVPVYENQLS